MGFVDRATGQGQDTKSDWDHISLLLSLHDTLGWGSFEFWPSRNDHGCCVLQPSEGEELPVSKLDRVCVEDLKS